MQFRKKILSVASVPSESCYQRRDPCDPPVPRSFASQFPPPVGVAPRANGSL
jgi:hypothetical protein